MVGKQGKKGCFLLTVLLCGFIISCQPCLTRQGSVPNSNSISNRSAANPAGSLGSNSILFDGMYYNWSGDFYPYGYWSGMLNYSFLSGNTFNVFEYISVAGGQLNDTYTINNQTRITN